jgi:hypothetical protein
MFSTCAIIGGVLTVAGLVDSMIFSSRKRLSGTNGAEGFGSREGKMVSLCVFPRAMRVELMVTPLSYFRCERLCNM